MTSYTMISCDMLSYCMSSDMISGHIILYQILYHHMTCCHCIYINKWIYLFISQDTIPYDIKLCNISWREIIWCATITYVMISYDTLPCFNDFIRYDIVWSSLCKYCHSGPLRVRKGGSDLLLLPHFLQIWQIQEIW